MINQMDIISLLNSIALLLLMAVVSELTDLIPVKFKNLLPWLNGVILSAICIAIMRFPFTLIPGVLYDTRSILISVTGLIFGVIPTVMTLFAAILYRLILGGVGTIPGVTVILTSAAIGLIWKRWLFPKRSRYRLVSAFLMGVTVHVVMFGCTSLFPPDVRAVVLHKIAFQVLVLYPIASVLLSILLIRQQENREMHYQLKQSEDRFRSLFEKAPLGYQSLDANGNFLEVNQ